MRVLDLFSGIGAFSLGLERAGMRTVAFCEIDPYCRRVLARHWPEVPCYDDVRTLDAARLAADGIGSIDVIAGGFPCQPVSVAGRRGATRDERWLWPEFARLIRNIRPRYVIIENVPGLLSAGEYRPDLGCICGWFGGRRRVDLDTKGKDDPALSQPFYQAGLEGEGYPCGVAAAARGIVQTGNAPNPSETYGGILLDGDWSAGPACFADDLSLPDDQEGTGGHSAALGLGVGGWGQRSLFPGLPASGADVDTEPHGTGICPACGRELVDGPGPIGGTAAAEVFNDLASYGLHVEWYRISAADVGAPHLRQRIWIVAYPNIGRGASGDTAASLCGAVPPQIRWQLCGSDECADVAEAAGARHGAGQCEPGGALWDAARWSQPERLGGDVADTGRTGRQQVACGASGDEGADEGRPALPDHQPTGDGEGDGAWPVADTDGERAEHLQQAAGNAGAVERGLSGGCGTDLAYPDRPGLEGRIGTGLPERAGERTAGPGSASADTGGLATARYGRGVGEVGERGRGGAQSILGGIADGTPEGMDGSDGPWGPGWEDGTPRIATNVPDRVARLRALGNSLVPQIPEMIGRAIMAAERAMR